MKYFVVVLGTLLLLSCKDSHRSTTYSLFHQWQGKEILFPSSPVFTIQGRDTVSFDIQAQYKVLTYVDSVGCTSCKLHLSEWSKFIHHVDSLCGDTVQFLFFFSPKKRNEIYQTLLADRFKHPVCIDNQDSIHILNHFPSKTAFQTFLLDKDNKVVAIGNPVYNPKIKDLYLTILTGKHAAEESPYTTILFDKSTFNMGTFSWKEEQTVDFLMSNTGKELLVINGVSTSCGCISVEYPREPVQPGKSLVLKVKYKADHPEHFNKTLTVYCNAQDSPIQLKISGDAQ